MKDGKEIDALALGDKEFYPIDSSDTSVTANEKTYYAVPSKITIKSGTSLLMNLNDSHDDSHDATITTDQTASDTVVDCVGAHDDKYFFVGSVNFSTYNVYPMLYSDTNSDTDMVGIVAKSDCTNIVW